MNDIIMHTHLHFNFSRSDFVILVSTVFGYRFYLLCVYQLKFPSLDDKLYVLSCKSLFSSYLVQSCTP